MERAFYFLNIYMARKKSQRELAQIQQKLEYNAEELRVFVADILPYEIEKKENMENRLVELENLVTTYG